MKYSAISLPAGKVNLDRYFADQEKNLFVVCDGTTGGGDFSTRFINYLMEDIEQYASNLPNTVAEAEQSMAYFIEQAHRNIPERLEEHYGWRINVYHLGAGSTIAMLRYLDGSWISANSGDSKIMLARGKDLLQLSYDDNQYNEWIEDGRIIMKDGKPQYRRRGEYLSFKGVEVHEMELLRTKRRMIRWVGHGAVSHVKIEPALPGDIAVLMSDGAEWVFDFHKVDIASAAISVARGEYDHLLAACQGFWKNYTPQTRLFDDATAMVVYA